MSQERGHYCLATRLLFQAKISLHPRYNVLMWLHCRSHHIIPVVLLFSYFYSYLFHFTFSIFKLFFHRNVFLNTKIHQQFTNKYFMPHEKVGLGLLNGVGTHHKLKGSMTFSWTIFTDLELAQTRTVRKPLTKTTVSQRVTPTVTKSILLHDVLWKKMKFPDWLTFLPLVQVVFYFTTCHLKKWKGDYTSCAFFFFYNLKGRTPFLKVSKWIFSHLLLYL